jgi:hypothetical protein
MVDVEAEFNPVIAKAFDCEIRKRLCPGGVAQWTSASGTEDRVRIPPGYKVLGKHSNAVVYLICILVCLINEGVGHPIVLKVPRPGVKRPRIKRTGVKRTGVEFYSIERTGVERQGPNFIIFDPTIGLTTPN